MRHVIHGICLIFVGAVYGGEKFTVQAVLRGGDVTETVTGSGLGLTPCVSVLEKEAVANEAVPNEKPQITYYQNFPSVPALSLFLHTRDYPLVIISPEGLLQRVARQCKQGTVVYFAFSPPLTLCNKQGRNVGLQGKPNYWDMVSCTAWVRSFVKWMVNPKAWWNPNRYTLSMHDCTVEVIAGVPVVKVNSENKDWGYLKGQVQQYLLHIDWSARWYVPYVSDSTAYILHFAIHRRFHEVEKQALESVGFVDVKLTRGLHPMTKKLSWLVCGTKQ